MLNIASYQSDFKILAERQPIEETTLNVFDGLGKGLRFTADRKLLPSLFFRAEPGFILDRSWACWEEKAHSRSQSTVTA